MFNSDGWQPKIDGCVGGGQQHVRWIESKTSHRHIFLTVQYAHFVAGVSIPNVQHSIGTARQNEL